MVEAEQRHGHWVAQALLRVLDHAGVALDFDVLSAEEYLEAARNAPPERLAEAGTTLVVDAPQVWVDAGAFGGRRGCVRAAPPGAPPTADA